MQLSIESFNFRHESKTRFPATVSSIFSGSVHRSRVNFQTRSFPVVVRFLLVDPSRVTVKIVSDDHRGNQTRELDVIVNYDDDDDDKVDDSAGNELCERRLSRTCVYRWGQMARKLRPGNGIASAKRFRRPRLQISHENVRLMQPWPVIESTARSSTAVFRTTPFIPVSRGAGCPSRGKIIFTLIFFLFFFFLQIARLTNRFLWFRAMLHVLVNYTVRRARNR